MLSALLYALRRLTVHPDAGLFFYSMKMKFKVNMQIKKLAPQADSDINIVY